MTVKTEAIFEEKFHLTSPQVPPPSLLAAGVCPTLSPKDSFVEVVFQAYWIKPRLILVILSQRGLYQDLRLEAGE